LIRFIKGRSLDVNDDWNTPPDTGASGINIHDATDPLAQSGPVVTPPNDNLPHPYDHAVVQITATENIVRGRYHYYLDSINGKQDEYDDHIDIYMASGSNSTNELGVALIELEEYYTYPFCLKIQGFPIFVATPSSSIPVVLTVEYELLDAYHIPIIGWSDSYCVFRCHIRSHFLDGAPAGHIRFNWSLTGRLHLVEQA
jgi:hypothetical protein